ncbi:MAG TPA: SusD/RagB family nutrient-binding outer membrane lipoprotein [Puia sp.]|nr:SusD/RagB family nutrient-binding outer membrane lipoprotein [Puia sp.]
MKSRLSTYTLQHGLPALIAFFGLAIAPGCTKNFVKINTDPTTFSSLPPATIPKAFAKSQWEGVYADPGNYEVIHSLYADLWSQYFVDGGGFPGDRYVLDQGLVIFSWSLTYTVNWPSIKLVIDNTADAPSANAVAKIWKVYTFHQVTDLYGPIPYSQAGLGTLSIPYDPQDAIYDNFFKTLDSAITVLQSSDPSEKPFGTDDLIYHGDIPHWLKFANSLRLRLALRISKIDPDRAKQEAEKAVTAGVMTANDDDAFVDVGPNSINGLCDEAPWENMRMSAAMESYLKGYSDPRMSEYWQPAEQDNQFHGMRNGMSPSQVALAVTIGGAFGGAINLSNINSKRWDVATETTQPLNVMYAAESYFLRAEGALNGWNMGGTPQDLYETGITTSLQQWGITDNTAIQNYINSTSTPVAPNDYLSSPAVANIPILFSADPAVQLQQIITQKWLALFPDGLEAWAELRRTGYPKLYPVVQVDNPDIAPGDIIRRLNFVGDEYQTNRAAVEQAASLLGGPDKVSTHVWWNK